MTSKSKCNTCNSEQEYDEVVDFGGVHFVCKRCNNDMDALPLGKYNKWWID